MMENRRVEEDVNLFGNEFLWRINPYIRRAAYDHIEAHGVIKERILYDYELLYIKDGLCTVTIDDHVYETVSGEIYIFKPGQRHSMRIGEKDLIQPHIHFDLTYDNSSTRIPISFSNKDSMTYEERQLIRSDVLDGFMKSFPNYIRLRNTKYMEQLLFSVISTWVSPTLYPEIELKYRFLRLLHYLLSEITWMRAKQTSTSMERAKLIKLYLERYTDHAVTLDELANVYHIDKSYVSRIFKAEFNITPGAYQLNFRINKARNMIRFTTLTLSEIAIQLGFSSLQDFSRTFRRLEGVPPSTLRKSKGSAFGTDQIHRRNTR